MAVDVTWECLAYNDAQPDHWKEKKLSISLCESHKENAKPVGCLFHLARRVYTFLSLVPAVSLSLSGSLSGISRGIPSPYIYLFTALSRVGERPAAAYRFEREMQ